VEGITGCGWLPYFVAKSPLGLPFEKKRKKTMNGNGYREESKKGTRCLKILSNIKESSICYRKETLLTQI
jgi:hypothetical protein